MQKNNFIERILPEVIETLPVGVFPGEIVVIDSLGDEFRSAVRYLKRQKVLGFDTETKPCFTPHAPQSGVALLQLSGPTRAFLFRIKSTGMHRALCNILSNPSIVKVGAATTDDIRGLQRYRRFYPQSFVDLQHIVSDWGIRDKSVKKMAAIIMEVKISKAQQLSNWEAESLSEQQQKYAATDAWICREMYLKLMKTEMKPVPEVTVSPGAE
ncbi:MAG: 3'-5' exonuclease [Candidatus Cryptobacteroides sp.]